MLRPPRKDIRIRSRLMKSLPMNQAPKNFPQEPAPPANEDAQPGTEDNQPGRNRLEKKVDRNANLKEITGPIGKRNRIGKQTPMRV